MILTGFYFILSAGPHERNNHSLPGNNIHKKRKPRLKGKIRFAENWTVLSLFCVLSYRQETERNRGTVVTYVAKASSLAKTLIKPLTITLTKPDLKAIHRACTKESGGMQVPSRPSSVSWKMFAAPEGTMQSVYLHWSTEERIWTVTRWKHRSPAVWKSVEFCSCCNLPLSASDNLLNC